MKKIFALVLALVMALSLTTVAWGADVTLTGNKAYGTGEGTAFVISTGDVEGKFGHELLDGDVYDGAGYTLSFTDLTPALWDTPLLMRTPGDVTIKNLTIDCAERGIVCFSSAGGFDVVIDNVTIENSNRPINVTSDYASTLTVTNSIIAGKVSYQLIGGPATFTDCTFVVNPSLTEGNELKPRDNTVFNNCDFEEGFAINVASLGSNTVTLTDCTYDGQPVTADNMATFFGAGVAAKATATNSNSVSAAKYDLHKADALGTEVAGDIAYVTVAAVKNDTTGAGTLEYIKMDGKLFVKVSAAKATVNDFYVTDANQKTPLFYLAAISSVADVSYDMDAVEFTNIGVKCGQLNVPYTYTVAELDFYVHTDVVTGAKTYFVAYDADFTGYATTAPYFNGGSATGAGNYHLLVGNEVVAANVISPATPGGSVLNQHVWSPVAYDKTTPTQALCGMCGAKATVYKVGKAPAGSVVEKATFGTTQYDLVVGAVASAPVVTPSTDKTVTSAQTFDAGIAMYVGMSVMAAAGGAVVIGKKKD